MRRSLSLVVTALALVAASIAFTAAPASAVGEISTGEEAQFLAQINALRASKGVAPLKTMSSITSAARSHTFSMADAGQIFHTSNLAGGAPSGWTKLGENVGYGGGPSVLMGAFINSPGHYQNLVDPAFTHIGIGVVRVGSLIYTTHRFVAVPTSAPPSNLAFVAPPPAPAPTAPPRTTDGTTTIGVIRGRNLLLRNSNSSGPADYKFSYGTDGDKLIFGDWNGDGIDTVGVQRGRDLFLRNSNTGGPANYVFAYGTLSDHLVWGDWDGNGTVTVGVQRGRDLMLRNSNTGGPADYVFSYGTEGDDIIFGDWDGNGTDTIGIKRGKSIYLRNSNTGGKADMVFTYGADGDTIVFGDWDGR